MRNNKGFTILELLAVLALITVVSAVAAPKIINTVSITKEQRIQSDMENIATALQRFCIEQELKMGNPQYCLLNGLNDDGVWYGANQGMQSQTIKNAIEKYLEKNVEPHFTIIITLDEDNWLTPQGYGSVSVWYPSLTADGKRYYSSNTKITGFKEQVYTQNSFSILSSHKKSNVIFTLDIDGDGSDDSNDFLIYNSNFKLNKIHSHTGNITIEPIQGTNGDDILKGTPNIDTMYGYAGNDIIYGYQSNDIIYGGEDNDTIEAGEGDDSINGGEGTDTGVFSGSWYEYSITGNDPYIITGLSGTDTLTSIEYLQFDDRTGTVSEIMNDLNHYIFGTEGNDNPLKGTPNIDIMYGYSGDDVIYGYEDNDTIYAGDDDDIIHGGSGDDTINGEAGTDTAVYMYNLSQYTISGVGPYTITGPEGTDTLINVEKLTFADITDTIENIINNSNGIIHGTPNADDPLMGTPQQDTIYGYGGNDTIYGLDSNDTIDGGEGQDTAVFSSYWVYYTISGDEPKIITGPDGTDTLISVEKLRFKDTQMYIDDFEDEVDDMIYGTSNDDYLPGSYFGTDVFIASEGHDVIRARWGLDTIVFNGPIEDYIIIEGSGYDWSSVDDGKGNVTYFRSVFPTKLQFTNDIFYAD